MPSLSIFDPMKHEELLQSQTQTKLGNLQLKAAQQQLQQQQQVMNLLLGQGGVFRQFFGPQGLFGRGGQNLGFGGGGRRKGGGGTPGTGVLNPNLPYGFRRGQPGAGEAASIQQGFKDVSGSALANLQSRGLGGSTLVPSTMAGIEQQEQLALGDLRDRMFNQRMQQQQQALGLFGNMFGNLLGAV